MQILQYQKKFTRKVGEKKKILEKWFVVQNSKIAFSLTLLRKNYKNEEKKVVDFSCYVGSFYWSRASRC